MIRAWMHLAAAVDRRLGVRCPLLWACSRTYRASFMRDGGGYHRFRGAWT